MKRILLVALLLLSYSAPSQANILDFLFGAGSFGRRHSPIADCRSLFGRIKENSEFMRSTDWEKRVVPERDPDYFSDQAYLTEMKYLTTTLGQVDTRFSKEFDTRFYFTSTAKPFTDGTIPMVDPEAKALIVYIHGSGTEKASGINFAGKMNSLAKLGYSAFSFDLPFHRDGSRNPALASTAKFAAYLDSILKSVRQPGQPVILVGHSFGPDIIAEYITRYPHGVDGAVMLSPGSFDQATKKWFANKTVYMEKVFGEVEANNFGGRWASMVTRDNIWNQPKKRPDPTMENPKLKTLVVSGDREEYIPGELDQAGYPTTTPRTYDVKKVFHRMFHNATVRIEPGVGHYIFAHNDENGHDVVMRSILWADGETLANEKALRAATTQRWQGKPTTDVVAGRYAKEIFFRKWLDQEAKKRDLESGQALVRKLLQENDKKSAQRLINDFGLVERQRVEALNANIAATKDWAPEFYEANKEAIEKLGNKSFDSSPVQTAYLNYLNTLPPEQLAAAQARVDEKVYVLPERPTGPTGPPADRPPRTDKPPKQKKQKAEKSEEVAPAPAE